MAFEAVIGHTMQGELLRRAIAADQLAHALLFTGLKGVGKHTLAGAAAQSVLCLAPNNGDACGECDSCRRFQRGRHPDYFTVEPVKKDITIDQVRTVRSALRIGPVIGQSHVVVIRQAGSMNPYAANALLKTLEEPSGGNFLFLTAEDERELLPTIVSRCQRIRLNPLPEEEIAVNVRQRESVSESEAEAVARLSGGSYGRALEFLRQGENGEKGFLGRRRPLIEALQGIRRDDSVGVLILAQQLDALKEDVPEFLEVLKTWYYDLLLFRYDVAENKFVNRDLVDLIRTFGPRESVEGIFTILEWIEKTRRTILNNGNRLLSLEVLLLRMAKAKSP